MGSQITISVTRTVDPDRLREAAAWARVGQDLLSATPGYLGSGWVRPDPLSPAANAILSTFASGFPLWLRVLGAVVLVTPIMTYFALPLLTGALRPWLQRTRVSRTAR